MAKTITPELMTAEECEVINRAVAQNCANRKKQYNKVARAAKAKQEAHEKLIHTAVRAVCVWMALMIILVPLVRFGQISLMVMDLVIYPVTLWVGICVGQLLSGSHHAGK